MSNTQEAKPSLYDILGVAPTATDEEIKKAYRRKAFELHPDHNAGDPLATEKFQQLGEAYAILRDPAQRERYDKFGMTGETPTEPEDIEIFDMVTQILGLGRCRGPPKGDKVSPSIRILNVPLSAIYKGGEVEQKISIHVVCPTCHGKGSTNGIEYPVCDYCHGNGSSSPGGLQFLFPCKNCESVGYMCPREFRCKTCKGRRVITKYKTVKVNVEIGCQDQEQFVLPNEGDEYPGAVSADLVLISLTKNSGSLFREGDDLYFIKKVSRIEAEQGTAFNIDMPDGRVLNVATPKGHRIRFDRVKWIKNEGLPCNGNVQFKGNLYIFFKFGFPGLITEGVRTIAGLIHRKETSHILEDAPEEIQESFMRRAMEQVQQEEQMYYNSTQQ